MSKKSRRKHLLENYDIGESLGEGGNGEVFLAINKKTRSKEAVKVLRDSWQSNKEKVERFKEEISVVNRMQKTMSGILPILEYDTDELWFTMPVAERIVDYIKRNDASAIDIIQGISFISETLSHLHKEGISHRDIKPENMYYCNGQFCISDFGLAKEESTPNGFTKEDKGLGAIFTIAPEMKRNPKGANGYAADVYSLAKTLWMLLMKNEKGFDGVYDFRIPEISLHSNRDLKETSLALIDDLLIDATKINPTNRPTMDEFNNRLLEWLNIQENWELIQETEWRFLKKYLFGDGTPVPRKAVWTKKEDIIYILNTITVLNVYNHMLLPSGGGLDFYQATEAAEDGCICIEADDHELFILKPEALYFESFEGCDDWNFFYLQIRELAPVIDGDAVMSEYIVEDYPGHYVSARYAQYGVYDYDTGEVLPKGFRCVDRYCKGSFLIVMKDGPYNDIHSAYDARHSKMGYPLFSKYISNLIDLYAKGVDKGIEKKRVISLIDRLLRESKQKEINEEEIVEQNDASNYIDTHIGEVDFSSCIVCNKALDNCNAQYWISYTPKESYIDHIIKRIATALLEDGFVKDCPRDSLRECALLFDSMEDARDTIIAMKEELIHNYSMKSDKQSVSISGLHINVLRTGTPDHIITKEEIHDLMITADDRKNNTLVINKNGYAEIIQGDMQESKNAYPVRLETWRAGNNYVGKYSKLLSLGSTYIMALEGWLDYLERGESIYVDYQKNQDDERNEEELKARIQRRINEEEERSK